MAARGLLSQARALIDSFRPRRLAEDLHVEQFFAQERRVKSEAAREFVESVFYGIVRHTPLLAHVVDDFAETRLANFANKDATLYRIFAYLVLFRLGEDISWARFEQDFVGAYPPIRLYHFLCYLFRLDDAASLRERWETCVDEQYIEELVAHARSFAKEARAYEARTAPFVENLVPAERPKQFTTPKPFKLAEPRPHDPEKAKVLLTREEQMLASLPKFKAKPVPPTTYRACSPDSNPRLKALKEEKRRRLEAIYSDPRNAVPPRLLETPPGRRAALARAEELAQAVEEEAGAVPHFANPPPKSVTRRRTQEEFLDDSLKHGTTASILRAEAVLTQLQQRQAEILHAYEIEGRDDSEYRRWREEQMSQLEEERLVAVERLKQETKQAMGKAARATAKRHAEKTALAEAMKKSAAETKRRQVSAATQDLRQKKRTVREVQETRFGGRKLHEAIARERAWQAAELKEAAKASARERAKLEAAQQRRLYERRQQLRALERVPPPRLRKIVDPNETSGQYLLCEMSLAEMRERAEIQRRNREFEVQQRRRKNLAEKKRREEGLRQKAARLAHLQQLGEDAQAKARAEVLRRRAEVDEATRLKDEAQAKELLAILQKKREARRAEFEHEREEARKQLIFMKQMRKKKAKIEEAFFEEQEKAEEAVARAAHEETQRLAYEALEEHLRTEAALKKRIEEREKEKSGRVRNQRQEELERRQCATVSLNASGSLNESG